LSWWERELSKAGPELWNGLNRVICCRGTLSTHPSFCEITAHGDHLRSVTIFLKETPLRGPLLIFANLGLCRAQVNRSPVSTGKVDGQKSV
jgi:hypothetical protein